MAQRKYLIIIFIPFLVKANPWIPDIGKFKYSFEISKEILPETRKVEFAQYLKVKQNIVALEKELEKLRLRISIAKSKSSNQENKTRLENYKNNRIDDLRNLKYKLDKIIQRLNIDYKLGYFSNFIEYGLDKDISVGINTNMLKSKYSYDNHLTFFGKYKLYEKNRKLLSAKPYISINNSSLYPGIDFIFGKSKKSPNKLTTEIFSFSFFGIERGKYGIIYNVGNQLGAKIVGNFIFLFDYYQRLEPEAGPLYQKFLTKRYRIGKELNIYESKYILNLGLHENISLSSKRLLSKGISFGIWGEI